MKTRSAVTTLLARIPLMALTTLITADGAAADDDAARAAASRAHVTLVTDAACALDVAGTPHETLMPDKPRTLALEPGEVAVECRSVSAPEVKLRIAQTLRAGDDATIAFPLGDLLAERACTTSKSTLVDLGGGTLRQCATRADWTQADNGADLEWQAAKDFCAQRGRGWQLPTSDEYLELADRSGRSTTPCGKYTCYVSPRFALTSPVFWAADEPGPGNAMMMTMIYGNRHPARKTISAGYRALCVKHRAQ